MADYSSIIEEAGKRRNVDPRLISAVIGKESTGNAGTINTSGGGKGAYGLMQVREPALIDYNLANGTKYTMQDLLRPDIGIDVGAWYLGQQLDRHQEPSKALIAYNQGPNSPEVAKGSSDYSRSVLKNMATPQAKQKNLPGIPSDDVELQEARSFMAQKFGGASDASAGKGSADNELAEARAFVAQRFGQPSGATAAGQPATSNPAAAAPIATNANVPGAVTMGIGDVVKGGVQGLVHGIGAIANYVAPNSQIAKDFAAGVPQVDKQIAAQEQAYAKQRESQGKTGVDWGRLAGNVVPGVLMPSGAAETMAGKIGLGALQGGAFGALQPTTNPEESYLSQKAGQVGYGALGGAAAPIVANAVGNVIAPKLAEGANALREAGVKLTPGQAFGGGFKALEDKLTSVPLLGDLIKNAQRGSVEDFNRAAYQRALDPINEKVTAPVGREAIEQVSDKLSAAYNQLLPKMQFAADQQFMSDMANVSQLATGLAEPQFKQLGKILENDLLRHMTPQGTMSGEALKKVENALTQKAKTYQSSAVGSERELGDALSTVLQSVRNSLERANPQYAGELAKINQGYANYARIRQAAAMTGAEHGIFTPAQLQNAVKSADKSVAKGNFAKGNALMQDLSEAGKSVIGNQYPDSGTAGRLIANGLVGSALGGGAVMGSVSPAALAAGAVAAAPYTGIGKSAFNALLNRPHALEPVAESVRRNLPRLIAPLTPAALTVSQ